MKPMNEKHFAILRRHMVEIIGIHADIIEDELGKPAIDERVLTAMLRVPRHLFVLEPLARLAYEDRPLPIGFEKTISQPFMCALMTDLLAPEPEDIVLEVGTGLGYQTALLAELVGHVWSIEIVEELGESAQLRLNHLGYSNVDIRIGDGSRGWSQHAPYDKILVAASYEKVHRRSVGTAETSWSFDKSVGVGRRSAADVGHQGCCGANPTGRDPSREVYST